MMFDQTAEWKRITEWSGVLQGFSEPEQLLATFISASNLGLAILDTQLKFQAINKALADMNGVPAEAHLGKSVRDILGNAAEHIEPIFHRVLLTGHPVLNVALTLQLPTRMEVGERYPRRWESQRQEVYAGVVSGLTSPKTKASRTPVRVTGRSSCPLARMKQIHENSIRFTSDTLRKPYANYL